MHSELHVNKGGIVNADTDIPVNASAKSQEQFQEPSFFFSAISNRSRHDLDLSSAITVGYGRTAKFFPDTSDPIYIDGGTPV